MNHSMRHRGPDDSGEEMFFHGPKTIGLAHRRLSILDLSSAGHQPMKSFDGRLTVVFNGEIYNYKEIRRQLKDYAFQSNCDTEVILAGYEKWGVDCISHFNGMFAAAIYDMQSDELVLFRDRFGKKPLYYMRNADEIVFASELKPLMLFPGFDQKIRTDVLHRFLARQYIKSPDTIFENVQKLEPGSYLRYKDEGVAICKYWDAYERYCMMCGKPITGYHEAKQRLKDELKKSVRSRLASDVPLGILLSAGYDSTLVASIAQEIMGKEKAKTFSIGFTEERINEAVHAKKIAAYLGTDHTQMYCTETEMLRLLDDYAFYYDEPFSDASAIPTMLVSRLAKKEVTVVLSGDGGDELFCGYRHYDLMKIAQRLNMLATILHAVGKLRNIERFYPHKVRMLSEAVDTNAKIQLVLNANEETTRSLLLQQDSLLPIRYEAKNRYLLDDWQTRRMLLDIDTYMTDDILAKVDRGLMRYSLECRCPILDKNVAELSFRIPQQFKYAHRQKKYILKDIVHDYVPRVMMDRPKMGFAAPLEKWLKGVLREQLLDYCNCKWLQRQGIFDAKAVQKTVKDFYTGNRGEKGLNHAGLLWSFLVFQRWYEFYFIKGFQKRK